jgi:hypothetical protein
VWSRRIQPDDSLLPYLSAWLTEIALLAVTKGFHLSLKWIPRAENADADAAARENDSQKSVSAIVSCASSMLALIKQCRDRGQPIPNLDWFASESDRKLIRYGHFIGGPDDAFGMPLLVEDVPFAFPPLNLYQKALKAWHESESSALYLVIPSKDGIQWKYYCAMGVKVIHNWEVANCLDPSWSYAVYLIRK